MLVLTREELAVTDVADHALDVLAGSGVREVVVVARRGPIHAAFTNPELRELGELTDADVPSTPRSSRTRRASRTRRRHDRAAQRRDPPRLRLGAARARKRVVLRFLLSPLELRGDGRVDRCARAQRAGSREDGPCGRAPPSERVEIAAQAVFRAIGYRGTPLADVPFDSGRGLIANEGGRVRPGEYVVGWAKRGPSGVIGTNKKDAADTVDRVLEDLAAGRLLDPAPIGDAALEEFVRSRQPDLVDYERWLAIDRHERGLGEPAGARA